MKFDCDRCKTRYSIADERVRGKILKIRCKNCSAVITVREGRAEASQIKPIPSARTGTVPAMKSAPASASSTATVPAMRAAPERATAPAPALRSAFDSVMASRGGGEVDPSASQSLAAPASLDDEWYLSEDGNQEGPYSLAEAQRIAASRPMGANLHCWCEGFDDWLPLDKVSQFRGVRDRAETVPSPAPTASAVSTAARRATGHRDLGEPKTPAPLFEKTLRAIEEENGETAEGVALPRPIERKSTTKSTGKAADQSPAKAEAKAPAKAEAKAPAKAEAKAPAKAVANTAGKSNGAAARAATAPPPLPRTPTGPAVKTPELDDDSDDAFAAGARGGRGLLDEEDEAAATAGERPAGDAMEFEFAEVSRVVNIASIVATRDVGRRTQANAAINPAANAAARLGRGTDTATALGAGFAAPGGTAPFAALSPDVLASAQPEVLVAKARRPHAVLYVSLLLAAVVAGGIVIWVVSSSGEAGRSGVAIGAGPDIEGLGYRFDTPAGKRPAAGTSGGAQAGNDAPGTASGNRPSGATSPNTKSTSGGTTVRPAGSSGTATSSGGTGKVEVRLDDRGQPLTPLSPDDIIRTSSRSSMNTRRCYERALKKDPFLEVKRIMVDLRVDAAGTVTSVSLSEQEDQLLGQCLLGVIRKWSFRTSTEGISTKFPLVFEQN